MFPEAFKTTRLTLRPIQLDDADAIFDGYAQDREVTRFLTWRPHQSRDDTVAYIRRCISTHPLPSRTYVLLDTEDGTVRGAFDLRRPAPHYMDYGYVLAKAWWGRGLMTEALTEIARWALSNDAIWRISGVCDAENTASARVMEKAGFAREGLLRRWLIHPNISDEPRDCLSYASVR